MRLIGKEVTVWIIVNTVDEYHLTEGNKIYSSTTNFINAVNNFK